jgi:hypothetical protein
LNAVRHHFFNLQHASKELRDDIEIIAEVRENIEKNLKNNYKND